MSAKQDDLREEGSSWLRDVGEYLRRRSTLGGADPPSTEAWTRFYGTCSGLIAGLTARYPLRPAEAEDVKQQVWLEILLRLPVLQAETTPAGFRSWLSRVARSKAVDLLREQGRHPACQLDDVAGTEQEPAAPAEDVGHGLEMQEGLVAIRAALDRLGKDGQNRNVRMVVMHYLEGRTHADIAEALKVRPEQVRDGLRRGLEAVRAELDVHRATPPPESSAEGKPQSTIGESRIPCHARRLEAFLVVEGCRVGVIARRVSYSPDPAVPPPLADRPPGRGACPAGTGVLCQEDLPSPPPSPMWS